MDSARDPRPLVMHLVHRFAVGGLENGVVNLINRMSERRWRHAVVALTDVDVGFAARLKRTDVPLLSLHKPPGQGLWMYRRLWRLFREHRPAVVHTRNLGTLEYQVPAWAAGVPGRVHGEHGRDADDVKGLNRRHILMRRAYRPFVQHHIALGGELADYLRQRVGVDDRHLTPIYNGVDHLRFTPALVRAPLEGSPFNDPALWVAGTVGRMQSVKAQTVLAQAFVGALRLAPSLRERLRVVFVGDGPLRAECLSILQAGGVAELAWLAGERSDVPEVMRALDCFVLPSRVEGVSNTILEAMSSGLPVLATDVGANRELVTDGTTGHIVPPDDPERLAQGLLEMAMQPQRAHHMGRQGRAAVEARFSLEAMVTAYENVYDRLLGRAGKE